MVKLTNTQKILLFEGIATMLLAFGVSNCNDEQNLKLGDTFVAICLLAGIVISAPFTGGHVNPSVTLGVVTQRKSPFGMSTMLIYWLGQLLGAIAGGILSWFCTGDVSGPVISLSDAQLAQGSIVYFHLVAS
jgi:glycerol uptake facilitator-like aquaporin